MAFGIIWINPLTPLQWDALEGALLRRWKYEKYASTHQSACSFHSCQTVVSNSGLQLSLEPRGFYLLQMLSSGHNTQVREQAEKRGKTWALQNTFFMSCTLEEKKKKMERYLSYLCPRICIACLVREANERFLVSRRNILTVSFPQKPSETCQSEITFPLSDNFTRVQRQ